MGSPKIILGYARCSGQNQAKDNESIPRQTELIKQYCSMKQLSQPAEIIIDEAISGHKANRPGYLKLVELCKSGTVETVICYDLSRLSRSVRTTMEFIEDVIVKENINLICLKQDISTATAIGKAFLTIISTFNELYRNEISEKTKSAIAFKKSKNEKHGGLLPYGYSLNGKQLVSNESEQSAIKLMLELRSSGFTFAFIAKELKKQNIKTRTGNSNWTATTIRTIINRAIATKMKVA